MKDALHEYLFSEAIIVTATVLVAGLQCGLERNSVATEALTTHLSRAKTATLNANQAEDNQEARRRLHITMKAQPG